MKPQSPPRFSTERDAGRKADRTTSSVPAASKLAHSLKTPLTSLELQLNQLLERATTPEIRSLVERSIVDVSEMKQLLGDTIALGRAKTPLETSRVNVCQVIESVVGRLSVLAESRNVHLDVFSTDDPELAVNANRRALELALVNVCENAIRFSHSGGRVRIGAQENGDVVRIDVCDHGVGIEETETERVLEPYFKFDRESRGSGLGLSIADELTRAQKGTMSVVSTLGEGTTVTFTLRNGREAAPD
jgi:signal transduction histidine kinase